MGRPGISKSWSRARKDTLQEVLFVSPQLLLFITLTILPFFTAIPMVLTDRKGFLDNEVSYVGFRNFTAIFQQPFVAEFLPALRRTITFTLFNYASVYVFGLTLALIMFEYKSKLKKPFFTAIYMPYMISGLGTGMLLNVLFAKDTGSMNLLLQAAGLIKTPLDIKSQAAVTWALPVMTGWRYAGVNLAFFLGGLLSIPTDSIEASVVDGAGYFQKLRFIYLPQIVPSIIMATVTCLIGSFNLIDELFGMGAMYANQSAVFLSVLVFKKAFDNDGSLSQSVAMSLTVFVPLIIAAFFLIRWQKKKQY